MPFRGKYQVKMLVDEAPGVAPDTPVRRRGLPIGRVASVEDTDDGALITMDIEDGKQIKSNEVGRIQTSLVGDADDRVRAGQQIAHRRDASAARQRRSKACTCPTRWT